MPNCIICGEKADSGFAVHGGCVKSVEVVRCGECIYKDKCYREVYFDYAADHYSSKLEFCSFGERGVENA